MARSALSRSSRSCASSICACLTASSERRSASRENSPSLNSCWSPSSCACADCSSSVLTSSRPSRSTSDFSSASRVCACWLSLILRSLTSFSSASTDSLTSSSTTGSPRFSCAPGRCSRRSTRASSGLESTRSTSGDDRAGRHDHRLDRPGGDARRADARCGSPTAASSLAARPAPARRPRSARRSAARGGGDPGVGLREEADDPRRDHIKAVPSGSALSTTYGRHGRSRSRPHEAVFRSGQPDFHRGLLGG